MITVTITGASSYFAKALLPLLEKEEKVDRIIGLDIKKPDLVFPKLEFHFHDVRDPDIGTYFDGVDVLIHLAFIVDEIKDKRLSHQVNVEGTKNVLRAMEGSSIKKIIYASSIAAYGSHPDNPDRITEEFSLRPTLECYYSTDKTEVEELFRGYKTRHPEVVCTIFRPCLVFGPNTNNMFTRFFSHKLVPTLIGKDVHIQFLHEEDLARALHQAIIEDHPGVFNLAPDDPIQMSELIKTTRSIGVPMPLWLAKSGANLLFRIGLMPFSQAWVSMQAYPIRVSSEKFYKGFGWKPRYNSQETWMDFFRVWNNKKQKKA